MAKSMLSLLTEAVGLLKAAAADLDEDVSIASYLNYIKNFDLFDTNVDVSDAIKSFQQNFNDLMEQLHHKFEVSTAQYQYG